MTSIFCCRSINPYRPQKLDHEEKFNAFMQWTTSGSSPASDQGLLRAEPVTYAVQLVKQVNFGPQESIRYFAPVGTGSQFVEVAENTLLEWNFQKLNSLYDIPSKKQTHEKSLEMIPVCDKTDISALKNVMKFLLPPSRICLESNCLLDLLCLDWLNGKFDLELELEPSWNTGLTSSNMIVFLSGCLKFSADDEVNLTEIEALVAPAMKAAELYRQQNILGRDRFQRIVNKILDSDSEVYWVSKYGCNIRSILESFPKTNFLEKALREKEKEDRGDSSRQDATGVQSVPEGESDEESSVWLGPINHRYSPHEPYDYGYDYEPMKDLTACDKECGYCGNCDY
ncbi:hypothetical protein PENANT_c007G00275 [Penicillium antarcticum]|uniref:Uncharacterized protein n=1 Tax=Penicillium antarcticum TaxID=416450 RepID=A0A1V6QC26_9EURO|nr:hypothetical protein PENANT_c007G00275 [Penicillium antarcticum]